MLTCTLRSSRFNLGRVRIAFDGPSDGLGMVLEIRFGKDVVFSESILRVAGEGWIELEPRDRIVPQGGVSLVLRLVDPSPDTGMRIDLGPVLVL